MLPKKKAYVKSYDDETKWRYFLFEYYELLKKYSDILNKISNSIKENLKANPSTKTKILKTKIKSCGDKTTDSHDKEMSKVDSIYICLVVILIDSVLKESVNHLSTNALKEM